ncbi:poly(A) binding protein Crp79 [Schizosaccharomyces cryophilus OY26]|uniref:Poly(A) binding protein Crp79 n=1 Tax=Schizosaccharomyces cryophilus (strain OY26 / ATCC MYA-4695 / CBS 11777 / NBRC 106824 / NRRL Y48691) TaxID=653667 RepID=S9W0Q1_SCHCR|nr:poly(A) binding protein Crp79 [Schizosaccharomyces cryophilus OY26]EPY53428.1 poly(A) binding protein Crp79 [Schizosaccharomyces cryophilus OY26]
MNNSKASIPGQYEDENCVIYIGNIDSRVSDEEIINLFSKYGQVVSLFRRLLDSFYPREKAKNFKPPRNGVQYGFIRFSKRDSVDAVLKDAKGMVLGKRKLSIKARVLNPSKVTEKKQKRANNSPNSETPDNEVQLNAENNAQLLDKEVRISSPKPLNSTMINSSETESQHNNKTNYTPASADLNFKEAVLSLGLEEFSMQAAPTAFSSMFTLTVMNIPAEMTPIDLYNYFKAAGTVKGTAVSQFTDKKGYRYGEVIMDSLEACKSAINVLNGSYFNGSKLDVTMKKIAYPNNRVVNLTPSTESLWPFPQEDYENAFFKNDVHNNGMTWMMGSPTKDRYQWGTSAEQIDISNYPKNNFPRNNALPSISQWESLQNNPMHSAPPDPSNLYVKNLDDTVISTKDQLEAIFSPFGNITSSMLACYPNSGISKGYGFVAFHRIEEAIAAKERLNGAMIGKKRIFVCFAERKTDRIRRLQELFAEQRATDNVSKSSIFVRPEKKVPVIIRKPDDTNVKSPTSSQSIENNKDDKSNSSEVSNKTENENQNNQSTTADENCNDVHDTTPKKSLMKEEKPEKTPLKENLNSTEIPVKKQMPVKSQSIAKNLQKIEEMLNRKKIKSSCFVPRAKATTCTTLTYVTVEPIHLQEEELFLEDAFPNANNLKMEPDMSMKPIQLNSTKYQDSNKENFESTVKVGNASPSAIHLSQL